VLGGMITVVKFNGRSVSVRRRRSVLTARAERSLLGRMILRIIMRNTGIL